MAKVKKSLYDFCLENEEYKYLLDDWCYEKNIIKPNDISYGSGKKVWWKCNKGHTYISDVHHKTSGFYKCPYCSGHLVIEGETDLKSKFPELLDEWDYEKNDKLGIFPNEVSVHSNEKVWWKCDKGHSFFTSINVRTPHKSRKKRFSTCPICANRKVIEGYNDLASQYPKLLDEWDYEKNNVLNVKPNEIPFGTKKKVWWKCKYGHSWNTSVCCRTRKENPTSCPICHNGNSSMIEMALYITLKKYYKNIKHREKINGLEYDIYIPELNLLIEYNGWNWHKDKVEQDLNKYKYAIKNNYNFFCIIEHQTKEYKEIISKIRDVEKSKNVLLLNTSKNMRSLISICKFIFENLYNRKYINKIIEVDKDIDGITREFCNHLGDKKSFAEEYPDIAKEWHPIRNGNSTPNQFLSGSSYKAWWVCEQGHEYKTTISHRTEKKGTSCPICSNRKLLQGFNDLLTLRPDIASEWDYKKNNIAPNEVFRGSGVKVWWLCEKGHSYRTSVNHRTSREGGCPYCCNKLLLKGFNDFASQYPEILKDWDYSKNIGIDPSEVLAGSRKVVWWKCKDCGNEWKSLICTRVTGVGCKNCRSKVVNNKSGKNLNTQEIFNSIKQASLSIGLKSISQVSKCCNGVGKTAGGYHWAYYEEKE